LLRQIELRSAIDETVENIEEIRYEYGFICKSRIRMEKWDLHVHTHIHTSDYPGDTDEKNGKFSFETLPKEIKVIGINDYLF
jgi:hypothetical protein